MKALKNRVVLKCIEDHKTKHVLAGGTELQIQTQRNNRRLESNSQLGVVVALPEDKEVHYKDDVFEIEVIPGDQVYVHHFSFFGHSVSMENGHLQKSKNLFISGGQELFSTRYVDCFFAFRESQIIMLNDFILLDPMEDKLKSSFLSYLPEGKKSKKSAKVVHVSKFVRENAPEIVPGVTAYFIDENCRYQCWIGGKEYYRARLSEIIAIEERKAA